jgi:poly-gamma-glutamate synthesis protein (capsule biosynthesis protein)
MKQLIFLIFLIKYTLEEGIFKRSQRSKHGEDCVSDSACEEGLFCRLYRCMTKYESKNFKSLGLLDKNLCSLKKKCPLNKKCVKHRCVDNQTVNEPERNITENENDVNLLFAGAILLNRKALMSGKGANNNFNYDHLFTHISKDIKNANLAIVEQETPFHINPSEKSFPKKGLNTPKEIADSIVNAGFKVVLHGTDYAYIKKDKGINNTLNYWKTNFPSIKTLGISSTLEESEKNYFIYKQQNITIGIINFSGFVSKSIPKQNKFMVNSLSIEKLAVVDKLKKETDFLIVCINWGSKDSKNPSKKQINNAKALASHGVDLIIGNHPIFVNPVSYVRADNGKKALVFWSLGLLVGDEKKSFSNLGALANIVISKGKENAYLSSYNLIPIINHKVETKEFSVYKLSDYTDELGLKTDKKFSLKKVKEACVNIMGEFANCD